ncbi:nitroreductase family protein [Paraburkholderia sp. J67]|uniref:nitroreductase family protein n=1 Tax=Paraburkholderia sp. J67 TaxID=2805435 RepID=UPI002ABDEFF6|nr:nitroreductase family protein [Paraburkholderia sp. J67]
MALETQSDRKAVTSAPIEDVLAWRWSPRSFDANATITDEQVLSILEAARWAPSAVNFQPRRFVVGKRGTPTFDKIASHLTSNNKVWAPNASLLILAIAVKADGPTADARPNPWAEYDTGQAAANIVFQAHALGLHAHQMAGMEVDKMREEFALPAHFSPITTIAIGKVADVGLLPEDLQAREIAERTRLPVDTLVLQRD